MMRQVLRRTNVQRIAAWLLSLSPLLAVAEDAQGKAVPASEKPATAVEAPPAKPVDHTEARNGFDWSSWQRIPVFHDGRIKPLDTFADEVVTLVTGRSKWSPAHAVSPSELTGENPPSKVVYRAPELLYAWITSPESWVSERIIRCEYRPLRQLLHDAKSSVPVEGTFVALDDIFDWKEAMAKKAPVYRSAELERRIQEIGRGDAMGNAPGSIGETADDKRLNTKVAELFRHMRAFLDVREALNIHVVPSLDPRVLTKQTDSDASLEAWVSLGALLRPETWPAGGDVTMIALMAVDNRELLGALDSRGLVPIAPQLAQARKVRDPILAQVRKIRPSFEATREAYAKGDASGFESSMQTFAREIRRLGEELDQARNEMGAVPMKSVNFGEDDAVVWANYTPLELFPNQMAFSAYPPPGSTDVEILYNKYQPFRSAWIFFLIALVIVTLSLIVRWQRSVYILGLVATFGAIAYSTWGFVMRIVMSGRPPVANMYETVIWVSFVVAALGLWFCLLPFTWPGLRWSWILSGVPLRIKRNAQGSPSGIEIDTLGNEDERRMLAKMQVPVRIATTFVRLGLFAWIAWFLTMSSTTFRIINPVPPIFGKSISFGAVGTWCIGMATVVVSAWFVSRMILAIAGALVTILPEFRRDGVKLWEQTFARRYFLFGALPVACFGMMLAHFVGMTNPEILNPRVGSIAAVLRNNYWLTIHVLTIVSSYGAGALAWGVGNLALLYYLFGKYRRDGGIVLGQSLSVAVAAEPMPAGKEERDGMLSRLGKAGSALKPGALGRTLKAGIEELGTGDEHLQHSKVRPPREVATLASYAYKSVQVAVLLLAAGTILGGLWADVSWGRFWDWDPKEVWALISLLAYLVVLHGRFAGWVGTFGTNAGSVFCFNAILFSWYGVNFVLPKVHGWLNGTGKATEVGLHSYATGDTAGLGYIAGGVVLNLLLLLTAWGRYAAETMDLGSKPVNKES